MMRSLIYTLFIYFAAALPASADIFKWQTTNIQLLRGYDYEIGASQRTIITTEHANKWQYGDNYAWVDWIWGEDTKPSYYGEFSPRISIGKILEQDLSFGYIKDFLISTTLEKPKNKGPRYLYGGAIDWNIPGFKFFKTNLYVRDDTQLKDKTWQTTIAWNRPFKIKNANLLIEGFADFSGGEGPQKTSNQVIVPRFLMDISHITKQHPGKLFLGMEYQYWHNKFGTKGITESVPQLQIKWVL